MRFDDITIDIVNRLNECADIDEAEGATAAVVRMTREAAETIKQLRQGYQGDIITCSLVINEVASERSRQNQKWGGPAVDDVRKTPEDWCLDIEAYNTWACQMHRMGSPYKYRLRMMQVAALAVAACESFDRKEGTK